MNYPPPGPVAKPSSPALAVVAVVLSLVGCIVMPLLAMLSGLMWHGKDEAITGVAVTLGLGGLAVAVSLVLAIVALARGGAGKTAAIVAIVFDVLSVPAGIAAATLALIFAVGGGVHGRPFRARASAFRTRTRSGDAWSSDVRPCLDDLDAATRSALAEAWAESASLEHASIAAFSSLSLDLLALGAPPELVARTHRAALDEVAHARDCFALASAYAGAPLTAAPFPEARLAPPRESDAERLRRVAVETAVDGVVGEGAAAAIARASAEAATDPVVARVLARIAEEEAAHAALASEVLDWALARAPELRDVVLRAIPAEATAAAGGRDLSRHGHASPAAWARVRSEVRARLVAALAPARAA